MLKKAISLVIVLTLCICLTPVKAIIPGEDAYVKRTVPLTHIHYLAIAPEG